MWKKPRIQHPTTQASIEAQGKKTKTSPTPARKKKGRRSQKDLDRGRTGDDSDSG